MSATMQDTAWRSFMTDPASYAESSRLAICFGVSVNPAFGAKLLENPRMQPQISALLVSRYELADVSASELKPEDSAVALLPTRGLQDLAKLAGAIYWSSAIASAVLGKEVLALHSAIGAEICATAIKHRDLGAPGLSLAVLDTLVDRITVDGWKCLAAWCDAMPVGVAKRVRLKLPASPPLDMQAVPPFTERGPNIVRRAAQSNEATNG
jgi:hypothetical protein